MAETRQWHLASRPVGEPTEENFELVTVDRPEPEANEVLVKTLYQSVDPYMRGRMRDAESYAEPWDVGEPMKASVVGEVVESNAAEYDEGDIVTGDLLWAEHAVADAGELQRVDPDHGPISTALGVLGMPGVTGYWGLNDVCDPKPGDTVFVSAAAGAVGSVVGQLAKLSGARVVGTAGSEAKIDWLTDELGFDAAINYKETDDLSSAVKEACPNGVDCYFDNVGGPITDAVWPRLNVDARVAVCGQIALYNETEVPTGPRKLTKLIETRATVEGLLVSDYQQRWGQALQRLSQFVQSGDIQYRENVVEGFENAPDAFLGLFEGENIGKQVVKVADGQHA
ncbi:NADP-dependent oxidoreductase [Natronolimnohabitans innermongolicus]|uniref:Alcohol dehydrogenase zinc-binding domain protein n=1 Tax=Natronolimnohabitans innermongolicus JCM 12255 TaxID=1227499 RepID=L9X288_9EURY|nr:NADP-dependent oxidoreductase [Natronolimnohabitans innermongolicus]ELY55879.1 alcohol dehydrogenase zinc-binding domain protein [Natronolimnohabitans innermongolicus JCM 12255]